ncbi:polysaccharide biosynthesis tyrosine autokinase [Citrobacter sp. JGM124]|uniref:polysaccharide biosynthesis tyrosine autokinase n=1 Tax=Citrobacter sp. JGM124 TaxID=2799789 RepID=UPI001BAA791B|nr:polysaccharide biosynthesis tyrosine autokinase [Citrobacter sp. JGM124]MBS0847381.1 polysaccharide biosynthesis tyrosine autokinase [Citrobacter sp. JGM124]
MTTKNTQKQNLDSAENELDLGRLLGDLIDHRKLITGVTLLSTACALVYALFATPVYQADTLIQVEQKKGNAILSSLSQIMPDSSPESAPEIQLLQSRMILGKTVNDLNLRTVVSQKHFPIFGLGWARLSGEPQQTLDVSWLNLSLGHDSMRSVIVTVGDDGHYQVELDDKTLQGTVGEILNSNGISIKISKVDAKPGTEFVVTQYSELAAINNLQQDFTVTEKSKDSGMLGLTMSGEDPQLIEQILNNISDNYLQQNIARQAAQDSKSLEFLQKKMPEVRNELDEAEDKLNAYRKQRDSVDLNLEAKSVLEQVVNVDNQLNGLTFREAEISQLYKKDHPTYRALIEKRQTLEQEKTRLNKRVSGMPATQQEVLRLSRDVESGRAVYGQLLNRQQELSIAQSSAIGNVRIIDPALTQPKPIKPKKALIVILGFFLGLFVSAGLVLGRSVLRRGIETPEQLEEQGINVYATVPTSEWLLKRTRLRNKNIFSSRIRHRTKNVPFLAVDNPVDLSIEAIRSLRTSLHFAMMEAANNVLMITGATPDSGKTFISSSLAAIIAQTGQKVLYIDADMRRGYAHELFQVGNGKGLSDILSGKIATADAIVPFTKGGFDAITRGQVPPNPSELLMHERFKQLLAWGCEHYDMVIIDTPPVLAVTDAAIIGRSAGTSLVVARFEMNSVKEIQVCVQRLEQSGVTVKGAILNGVMKRASSHYGYGYNHYGYSYTDKA